MAPTEILAEQHFRKLVQWLEPLGVTVAWLTGSRKGKARAQMVEQVASGEAHAGGGHARGDPGRRGLRAAGLAIVDEQHRFGVAQRLALRARSGGRRPGQGRAQALEPHLLMMSATPIPRTLAMSYYADLDVSTIDELPPGRTPIVTKVSCRRPARPRWSSASATRWRRAGRSTGCARWSRRASTSTCRTPPPRTPSCAALPGVHGGPAARPHAGGREGGRDGAVHRRQMQVLVATTVIEVGVDVPNASLMVIEHAERFGLAQLHQLRGRVGRGAVASVCVLLYTGPLSPPARRG
jgi:ATP-dependent DNA helicase RecG